MKIFRFPYAFILLLLLTARDRLPAQPFNFSFEHFNTEDGLSHESITTLTKDPLGFLWIGTASGLNRFDGISFKVFRHHPDDPSGIPGNYIAGTTLDKKGKLWVSTNKGICRIDPETLQIKRISLAVPGDSMSRYETMYGEFDSKGTGWFIVSNFLYAINQENLNWTRYPLPTSYYHGNIVQVDKKDRIWMSIGRAKYRFYPENNQFRYLLGYDNDHRDDPVVAGWIKEDENSTLWMCTWSHGFYRWNEEKENFESWKKTTESVTNFEFDKTADQQKFVWCGGGSYGLMVYDPAENKFIAMRNDPRDPFTHNLGQAVNILKDTTTGIVWIGTENGLEKYDPLSLRFKRFRLWQNRDEQSNTQYFFPSGFVQDKTDPSGNTWWVSVWIGGVFRWNRAAVGTPDEYEEIPGIRDQSVYSMMQASDGMIWVGNGYGIQILDPVQKKFIRTIEDFYPQPNRSRVVTHIIEDRDSNIWFTTYQGSFSWQRKTDIVINWKKVLKELAGINPASLSVDNRGHIWISGLAGPARIDPVKKSIEFFANKKRKGKKLPEDNTGAILVDSRQHVWVAGVNFLAKLDQQGEVISFFDEGNGFLATSVYNILEDKDRYIWVASDNKLLRLNPADGQFDYFDRNDGLFNNKIGDGFYIAPNGELLIGFNGAICSINTTNIPFNKQPPALVVSSLLVKGKPRLFDEENRIKVKPGERNIIIEFAALNFSQAQKNRFAFWLEGYDSSWRYTTDRVIKLMNLEGGLHRLRVRAANNDGVWSEEKIYYLKVIPPFHATTWFRLAVAAAVALVAWSIIYYRRLQRRKLDSIRQRIATDLHDDMGSTLSSIRIFSDVAKNQIRQVQPDTVPLLEKISDNATSLSNSMQDIIWTIRSDNDTLEDLVARMREFGLRICDARNISFVIEISTHFKASKLSLEQRRNLYLIFREALNNAVKYSECTNINLSITQQGRFLKMQITDNGRGFDAEHIRRGNGLNNLEKRSAEIGGAITINSEPGKGTRINLLVVLKKQLLPDA